MFHAHIDGFDIVVSNATSFSMFFIFLLFKKKNVLLFSMKNATRVGLIRANMAFLYNRAHMQEQGNR